MPARGVLVVIVPLAFLFVLSQQHAQIQRQTAACLDGCLSLQVERGGCVTLGLTGRATVLSATPEHSLLCPA